MTTIKELQKDISEEKKKLIKAKEKEILSIKRSQLRQELFKLKHRKAIAAKGKAERILTKAGKGIIKVGKTAIPIIQKQARLIREQQLRDDALERKLKQGKKEVSKKSKKKKGKKAKKSKKKKSQHQELEIFSPIDF